MIFRRNIQIDKSAANLQAQLGLAAVSCRITETLMSCYDRLNKVPCSLVSQLRRINDLDKYGLKENSPVSLNNQSYLYLYQEIEIHYLYVVLFVITDEKIPRPEERYSGRNDNEKNRQRGRFSRRSDTCKRATIQLIQHSNSLKCRYDCRRCSIKVI